MSAQDIYQELVHADTDLRKKIADAAKQWHKDNRQKIVDKVTDLALDAAEKELNQKAEPGRRVRVAMILRTQVAQDWELHCAEAAGDVVYRTGDKAYAYSPFCVLPNPDWGDTETSYDWEGTVPRRCIDTAKRELQRPD